MSASVVFGVQFGSWEFWMPALAGMLVGAVSLLAVRGVVRRRRAAPPAPAAKASLPAADPFVHGSATEQRRSLRRSGNPVPVFLKSPTDKDPSWRGWVFDRSMGGIGLVVDSEFPIGTLLRVLPVHAPESTPWVEIEVRSCRQSPDGYELGCAFVKTPPWGTLLLFG